MRPREHVLVVGGGIAGLALAAALDHRRVHVTLVEERPERAGAGTVLALWRGGRDALDAIGVGEATRRTSLPVTEAALPPTVTRLTELVTDPRALASSTGADLVVGADGVRSAVRQHTWAGSAPVVTDWIALRGHLPGPPVTTATEWWGRGGLFGVTPGPQGAAWFAAVRGDHRGVEVDRGDALALARGHLADWDPRVGEVLTAVGDAADAQRVLIAPPLRTPVDDGLVLVGDAAHAMGPNLGRGANEALADAAVLAYLVHRHGTKGAPRVFARRRHLRGQVLRAVSLPALRVATSRLW